ncbi:MAG: S1 RNA-binding domain-containing protein, partial [Candidatus Uhrbacteria bacterium]
MLFTRKTIKTDATDTSAPADVATDVLENHPEETTEDTSGLRGLLADKAFLQIPKVGDLVSGIVVGIGRNEVKVDLPGYRTGLIRGPELIDASGDTAGIHLADTVEATVLELENERGFVELSFRAAGHAKAWNKLDDMRRTNTIETIRVIEANKGGLIVKLGNVQGFLPVSQLSPGNYPRVSGGDKQRILEKLRQFIGKTFEAKVIDVDAENEKLIFSEKAAWEETQSQVLAQYHVGDHIAGQVTALADFGAFVRFPLTEQGEEAKQESHLEGLIHISELSWQRVDHPRDVVQIGDKVDVEIINIEGSKIFLSLKRTSEDPWVKAAERYQIGQRVHGTIVKMQPFGIFVELDPEIHGLAHISELGDPPPQVPEEVARIGEDRDFIIISLDPKEHRLGLSLKAVDAPESVEKPATAAAGEESPEAETVEVDTTVTDEKEGEEQDK